MITLKYREATRADWEECFYEVCFPVNGGVIEFDESKYAHLLPQLVSGRGFAVVEESAETVEAPIDAVEDATDEVDEPIDVVEEQAETVEEAAAPRTRRRAGSKE